MLMPSKHLRLDESVLGLGAIALTCLRTARSFDDLWMLYAKKLTARGLGAAADVELFSLVLDWLFLSGSIEGDGKGGVRKCG